MRRRLQQTVKLLSALVLCAVAAILYFPTTAGAVPVILNDEMYLDSPVKSNVYYINNLGIPEYYISFPDVDDAVLARTYGSYGGVRYLYFNSADTLADVGFRSFSTTTMNVIKVTVFKNSVNGGGTILYCNAPFYGQVGSITWQTPVERFPDPDPVYLNYPAYDLYQYNYDSINPLPLADGKQTLVLYNQRANTYMTILHNNTMLNIYYDKPFVPTLQIDNDYSVYYYGDRKWNDGGTNNGHFALAGYKVVYSSTYVYNQNAVYITPGWIYNNEDGSVTHDIPVLNKPMPTMEQYKEILPFPEDSNFPETLVLYNRNTEAYKAILHTMPKVGVYNNEYNNRVMMVEGEIIDYRFTGGHWEVGSVLSPTTYILDGWEIIYTSVPVEQWGPGGMGPPHEIYPPGWIIYNPDGSQTFEPYEPEPTPTPPPSGAPSPTPKPSGTPAPTEDWSGDKKEGVKVLEDMTDPVDLGDDGAMALTLLVSASQLFTQGPLGIGITIIIIAAVVAAVVRKGRG